MKKLISKIMVFAVMVMVLMTVTVPVFAASETDRINDYEIKVDVRQDGTLDITYDITWTPISTTVDPYPVTWVTVGIPNENVDQITAITDNITSIKYESSNGQSAVRVDFNKGYVKDETFEFSFSIHQSYMFKHDDGQINYKFTPGWFDTCKIENLQIEWATKAGFDVTEEDSIDQSSSFYIWSYTDLAQGEKVTCNITYDDGAFAVNDDEQRSDISGGDILFIIFIAVIIIFVVFFVIAIICDDGYGGGSGYGGNGIFVSSCASSCAHSSCACACACAGGGRAGCSAKDFYFKNEKEAVVDTSKLGRILKKSRFFFIKHK